MSYILSLIFIILQIPMVLFDFNKDSEISSWVIVNDAVMSGLSNGNFRLNSQGHGVYAGKVSLENNGGFSSLRYRLDSKNIKGYTKAVLKIKGDGKKYQFRVKSTPNERHSYMAIVETTNEWQTIEISLADMYPVFRGTKLTIPNFPVKTIEELAFLIGNKKAESFQLEIDSIFLK